MQNLSLAWPIEGVVKRQSYHAEAFDQSVCPDALNVRPDCSILSRERGGSRPGLVKFSATELGGGTPVRMIAECYYVAASVHTKILTASAGGTMYKESGGTFSAIATQNATLTSDRPLVAVDLLNKLYVASDNSASDQICVYDPTTDQLDVLVASAGTVPTKCWMLARFGDRLVAAGDRDNPDVIYASARRDPTDWDYASRTADADSWVTSAGDIGSIGEPVTALIAHGNDCLLVGCSSSLWAFRSDPGIGGRADNLSQTTGMFDYTAWCHDPEGNLWFLSSTDGLYWMPAGCGLPPVSVSREKLPEELVNLTRGTDTVTMAYDIKDRGIHLTINGSSDSAWWLDVKVKRNGDQISPWAAFWPQTYQSTHYPVFQFHRKDQPLNKSQVLWGGEDGYVRRHDDTASQDDGTNNFTSYCNILFPLGQNGMRGTLGRLEAVTAANSGDVDIDVYVGDGAEAAVNATVEPTSYTFNTAGWNTVKHPRKRGTHCMLSIKNGETNSEWAVEEIIAGIEQAGARR